MASNIDYAAKYREEKSRITPLGKVFLLNVLSNNYYMIYWFYKNWKALESIDTSGTVKPGLWTFGYFVPFWNIFIIVRQFSYIKNFVEFNSIQPNPFLMLAAHLLWLGPIVVAIGYFILSLALHQTGGVSQLICHIPILLLCTGCISLAQSEFNKGWEVYEQNKMLPVSSGLNTPEIIFLILGILSWGIMLLSLVAQTLIPRS